MPYGQFPCKKSDGSNSPRFHLTAMLNEECWREKYERKNGEAACPVACTGKCRSHRFRTGASSWSTGQQQHSRRIQNKVPFLFTVLPNSPGLLRWVSRYLPGCADVLDGRTLAHGRCLQRVSWACGWHYVVHQVQKGPFHHKSHTSRQKSSRYCQ